MTTKNDNPFKPLSLAMFILLLIVLACTFTGCKSKQKITEREQTTRIDTVEVVKREIDTVIIEKIKTITLPASSDNVVDNPCDDQGNLKPINQTITSGNASVSVYSKDGKLYISQKIDSVSSSFEREYRSRFKQDSIRIARNLEQVYSQVDKKTVYVWPWWVYALIVYGVVSTALNLYQKFSPLPWKKF
tara:strand:- start:40961 stop:41527 length:567 start_codon:yes stop_codon:yes gene_type:complete